MCVDRWRWAILSGSPSPLIQNPHLSPKSGAPTARGRAPGSATGVLGPGRGAASWRAGSAARATGGSAAATSRLATVLLVVAGVSSLIGGGPGRTAGGPRLIVRQAGSGRIGRRPIAHIVLRGGRIRTARRVAGGARAVVVVAGGCGEGEERGQAYHLLEFFFHIGHLSFLVFGFGNVGSHSGGARPANALDQGEPVRVVTEADDLLSL